MNADSDRPKVTVMGQVLGPIGEAAIGVKVKLKSSKSDRDYSARTDESGEFKFSTVEVGDGYRLNVMPNKAYEAYQSEVFSLGPEDEFFEIELDGAKFASLSGTVTDLYGKPLNGFQLWLRGVGTSAQPQLPVRTDVAGRFRLEELRAGEVVLETRSRPLLRASNIVLQPGKHKDIDIPLDWGTEWLLGRVVDAQDNPVAGATVIVSWKEQLRDLISDSRRDLRSDLGGNFAASNLSAEHYTLTVQAPGFNTYRSEHTLSAAADELVIQMH
jgi:NOL1/NOP2/fmu family ribosome biogenesis protein